MSDFIISAPGKVILFGEHAVVHNKPAIAAAVSLRTYTRIEQSSDPSKIELDFPDINFDCQWSINELPWKHFPKYNESSSSSLEDHRKDILNNIESLTENALQETALKGIKKETTQYAASLAFICLYMSICSENTPGKKFTVRSTLPVGAGLGSSACLSVCLSAALLILGGYLKKPTNGDIEKNIDLINGWAYVGERCIHGNPSGVDNTVATRGGAVKFQKNAKLNSYITKPIENFPQIELLLTNTGQTRLTSALVANVKELKKDYPTVIDPVLDAIEHVSERAYEILTSGEKASVITNKLSPLVNINQGLLAALGVSHPKLEHVKIAADSVQLGATKLTGAGGGGCAITFVTTENKQEVEAQVSALREKLPGFGIFDTLLGGPGVGYTESYSKADTSNFKKMDNSDFEKFGWSYWSS